MRALRISMAAACLLGVAPALAGAQSSYTPAFILEKFRPTQKGVDYDTPTEKAAVDACKVEKVLDAQQKPIGIALRDGQGKLLRRFVDANGKAGMDQWSYYQDGFEVYRDVDLNDDLKVDESRWLNSGGTRIAAVQGGKITGWRRLSAEEASKVLAQGLLTGDLALLETVLATPAELEALGLPEGLVKQATAAAANRRAAVEALLPKLTGWDKQTVWLRFDGTMPHAIPADGGPGLKGDLTLYENAVIFAGPANGQGDPTKAAYLQVPEMIKIGETWKFVDLPRPTDPVKPSPALAYEGIRSWLYRFDGLAGGTGVDPARDAGAAGAGRVRHQVGPATGRRRQEGHRPVSLRADQAAPQGGLDRLHPRGATAAQQGDRRQPGRRLPDRPVPPGAEGAGRADQAGGQALLVRRVPQDPGRLRASGRGIGQPGPDAEEVDRQPRRLPQDLPQER
jgi:hypothetical protein